MTAIDRPILLIGTARCGKTWVGGLVARARGSVLIDEPDNHGQRAEAYAARFSAGERCYPALAPGADSAEIEQLWAHVLLPSDNRGAARGAFRSELASRILMAKTPGAFVRRVRRTDDPRGVLAGRSREPLRLRLARVLSSYPDMGGVNGNLVATSAHSHLLVEWIAERFSPRVVILRRDPRALFGAWLAEGWADYRCDPLDAIDPARLTAFSEATGIPGPDHEASSVARMAWLIGFLTYELEAVAARNPDWLTLDYEHCVRSPAAALSELTDALPSDASGANHENWPTGERLEARRQTMTPPVPREVQMEVGRVLDPFGL